MRSILVDNEYKKITYTTCDTVIQNVGSGSMLISVQDYDIKPTSNTGFIINPINNIKIPSGKYVYGKSHSQDCEIEVTEC